MRMYWSEPRLRLRIIWRTFRQNGAGRFCWGALASVYGKEDGGADTAVWLAESKEETGQSLRGSIGQSSIAHETIEALRESGLLDDIIVTKEGLVVYPSGLDQSRAENRR